MSHTRVTMIVSHHLCPDFASPLLCPRISILTPPTIGLIFSVFWGSIGLTALHGLADPARLDVSGQVCQAKQAGLVQQIGARGSLDLFTFKFGPA